VTPQSLTHSNILSYQSKSSFTGSAGLAIVSKTTAYLITDSRYWLQAEKELDENWRLIRTGMEHGPRNWVDWIVVRAPFSILWTFVIDATFPLCRTVPMHQGLASMRA
jgi:hypothetical protein